MHVHVHAYVYTYLYIHTLYWCQRDNINAIYAAIIEPAIKEDEYGYYYKLYKYDIDDVGCNLIECKRMGYCNFTVNQ